MCLTCERIRLTFGLFSLLLHGFKNFLFHFHFMHLGRAETSLFLATTLWGSTKSSMLTLELIKKRRKLVCSQQCPQFINVSSILTKFEQGFEKKWKKKRAKNKKMNNLEPWFTLQFFKPWALLLSYFFWSRPIGFRSKMMPRKLNHNMICLCLGSLSKSLRTNRNAQFHWTLV
jgi:hypothetical protein